MRKPQIGRPYGPKRQCNFTDCFTLLNMGNRSGFCQAHHNSAPSAKARKAAWAEEVERGPRARGVDWSMRAKCMDCGKGLQASNVTGFCSTHRHFAEGRKNLGSVRRTRERKLYVEHVSRRVVWERDQGRCHICSSPADAGNWHLDHVIPISKNGTHEYANTAVSHRPCNVQKLDKVLNTAHLPAALGAFRRFHGHDFGEVA